EEFRILKGAAKLLKKSYGYQDILDKTDSVIIDSEEQGRISILSDICAGKNIIDKVLLNNPYAANNYDLVFYSLETMLLNSMFSIHLHDYNAREIAAALVFQRVFRFLLLRGSLDHAINLYEINGDEPTRDFVSIVKKADSAGIYAVENQVINFINKYYADNISEGNQEIMPVRMYSLFKLINTSLEHYMEYFARGYKTSIEYCTKAEMGMRRVSNFDLNTLVVSQKGVYKYRIDRMIKDYFVSERINRLMPILVLTDTDNSHYLIDGNHRSCSALLAGKERYPAIELFVKKGNIDSWVTQLNKNKKEYHLSGVTSLPLFEGNETTNPDVRNK
ncbi:MAG: ParB/Srx family N-terminal domain-containing protein, partial [Candidatus Margulisiibacteriota bacterium]